MVGFSLESVVGLLWIRWSPSLGTGGRLASEYAVDIPGTDSGDLELARSLVGKSPEEKARVVLLWRRAQEKTDEVVERLRDEGVYEVRPASGNPMDIIMLASILEALQESEDD